MGRKSKTSGSKSSIAKPSSSQSRKDKNVFKVANSKGIKKPKAVRDKLKIEIRESVKNKREKVDADLKDLHKDLVMKKARVTINSALPIKKSKKPPGSAKAVAQKVEAMKISTPQQGQTEG